MTDPGRTIFRPEAYRRYIHSREQAVLPRFVSPPTFLFLWMLLGLLAAGGLVAWLAEVPVYAAGPAAVVDGKRLNAASADAAMLVAFLPPGELPGLRAGQRLFVHPDAGGERTSSSILAVEPGITSPEAAAERFGLAPGAAAALTQPAAVAIARFEPAPGGLPAAAYLGSVYQVEVEVGSRRLISLLPVVGGFFEAPAEPR